MNPETKRCSKCGRTKPSDEFYRASRNKDGLQGQCKACAIEYRVANRVRVQEYQRQWNANLSDEARARKIASTVAWQKDDFYGKERGWYDAQCAEQNGLCLICGEAPKTRRLYVDHAHACCPGPRACGDCVRGLLCPGCNMGLGFLENHEWAGRAMAYLAMYRAPVEVFV